MADSFLLKVPKTCAWGRHQAWKISSSTIMLAKVEVAEYKIFQLDILNNFKNRLLLPELSVTAGKKEKKKGNLYDI